MSLGLAATFGWSRRLAAGVCRADLGLLRWFLRPYLRWEPGGWGVGRLEEAVAHIAGAMEATSRRPQGGGPILVMGVDFLGDKYFLPFSVETGEDVLEPAEELLRQRSVEPELGCHPRGGHRIRLGVRDPGAEHRTDGVHPGEPGQQVGR